MTSAEVVKLLQESQERLRRIEMDCRNTQRRLKQVVESLEKKSIEQ